MDYHILLKSLNFACRRENIISKRYPDLYNQIINYTKDSVPFKQKVYNYLHNIDCIPICKSCKNKVGFFNNTYSTYCSNKCKNSDQDFIDKSSTLREKSMLSKYGVKYTFDMASTKDKIKNTLKEKYDIDNISKLSFIKDKISNTKKQKTIVEYNNRSINLISIDENRVMKILCDSCNSVYEINYTTYLIRIRNEHDICINCNQLNNLKSSHLEKKISKIISDAGIDFISNYKIGNRELDIYLPDKKIGFEFNGLYWHSEIFKEKNYHLNKTLLFLKNNINIFHIWEDDWIHKQDIVKSMILNKIGKTNNRIFARKCDVREVFDNKMVREFLTKNHIQGFIGSKYKIGLFFKEELVSLMTFGNLRRSLGQKSKDESYELLRFCNKLDTNAIGGASRIFKYFLNNYPSKEIISYSDLSRSNGDMYLKLGFKLSHTSRPNYYYVVNGIRKHRFNYRKDRLIKDGFDPNKTEIQIMSEQGYYKIFDCGMQKWVWKSAK